MLVACMVELVVITVLFCYMKSWISFFVDLFLQMDIF